MGQCDATSATACQPTAGCRLGHLSRSNRLQSYLPPCCTLSTKCLCYAPGLQVQAAYALLDGFHHGTVEGHDSVLKHMADAEALREQQDLFELYVSDYVFLTRCLVSSPGSSGVGGMTSLLGCG